MIEESLIVKDTRKIRYSISERFDHNTDLYIDYLLSQKPETVKSVKCDTEIIEKSRLTGRSSGRTKPAA
ncbi:MAG: hypothetical protein BWK80_11320 [Desulfobacteraceae bacterium IS3]|nr:MAG: hypothetical protein BWK80_11320 [Desulfobacteraceae bacterium IS3]